MAITNQSDLRTALNGMQICDIYKGNLTAKAGSTWQSLWKAAGQPASGATPPARTAGSGYVPTSATTGAIPFKNAATSGYLLRWEHAPGVLGSFILYDRMWACSGFDTTVTTEQTITTPGTLTAGRDPNSGADVRPYMEVYTAPGATGATWELKGTDAAGNTNVTWTYTHAASAEVAGQMAPFVAGGSNAASTPGIRVATSLTCDISSGTAGDVGVTLVRRLAFMPQYAINNPVLLDAFGLGMPRIYDNACLALIEWVSSTSSGVSTGSIGIGEH